MFVNTFKKLFILFLPDLTLVTISNNNKSNNGKRDNNVVKFILKILLWLRQTFQLFYDAIKYTFVIIWKQRMKYIFCTGFVKKKIEIETPSNNSCRGLVSSVTLVCALCGGSSGFCCVEINVVVNLYSPEVCYNIFSRLP